MLQHHHVDATQCMCCSPDQELQDIREEGDPESEPLTASFDSFHQGGTSQHIDCTDNNIWSYVIIMYNDYTFRRV